MLYFVVSDIHSSYDELMTSLLDSGYEEGNPNHTLIVVGDIFDRGNKPLEVYQFLSSLKKENLILIKGNHEDLFLELLRKNLPEAHDFHNGTVKTFFDIAGKEMPEPWQDINYYNFVYAQFVIVAYEKMWQEVVTIVREHEITNFVRNERWLNYYELDNYIFTHSWFPKGHLSDWREIADQNLWAKARFDYLIENLDYLHDYVKDKTLVVGHLHSIYYHQKFDEVFIEGDNSIFVGPGYYVIDTNVIRSGKIGVLKIEQ